MARHRQARPRSAHVRAIERKSKAKAYARTPASIREAAWRFSGIDMQHWSYAHYLEMLAAQHGRCPGCGHGLVAQRDQITGKQDVAHVDHDHATGRVRGLLCDFCNKALGLADDNPAVLRNLATYLEQTGGAT